MDELLTRFWTNVVGRLEGPLTFRFLLQPTVAMFFALRDGIADARSGRMPYTQALFAEDGSRSRLLRDASASVARVLLFGAIMDLAYQLIVFRWVYVGELIFIVLLLVFVPYLIVRGPANRIARWVLR